MNEYQILTLLIGIPLLYSLGGMGFHKIPRRFGIPLLLLGVALWAGNLTIQRIVAIATTCPLLCLGYGEHHSTFDRVIYAFGLSLPTLIIGFNWWIMAPPLTFLITWSLSNNKPTRKLFNWRVCEYLVGASVGILWSQVLC
jgi:hypothetical protein